MLSELTLNVVNLWWPVGRRVFRDFTSIFSVVVLSDSFLSLVYYDSNLGTIELDNNIIDYDTVALTVHVFNAHTATKSYM